MLVARPRLVVYNISAEELHPVLAEAAARLDPGLALGGQQPVAAEPGRAAAPGIVRPDAERVAGRRAAAGRISTAGGDWPASWPARCEPVRVKPNPRGDRLSAGGAVLLMAGERDAAC